MVINKKKIYLIILLFILISSVFSLENYSISKISISGNDTISDSKLKKNLTLKEKSIVQKILFWQKGNQYHEEDLNSDITLLQNIYQKEGFLAVEIFPDLIANDEKNSVEIQFDIIENEPVLIDSITFDINKTVSSDQTNLKAQLVDFSKELGYQSGLRFRDKELLRIQKKIEQWLIKQGYAHQNVTYDLQLNNAWDRVNVHFDLNTGPVCYFDSTIFRGLEKVPQIILAKHNIKPGTRYNPKPLQSYQRKLQRLGMFQYVTVRAIVDETKNQSIPIEVDLKEAARLSIKTGVGYGQEDKFRASLTVTKLGFLGGIRKAVLFAKYSALEPYNLSLKLTQPALFHNDGSLSINPFARKEKETGFTISRMGAFLIYDVSLSSFLDSYLNYGIDWNNLKAASPLLEDELIAEEKGDYRESSATIGFSYDDSQPMFSPETGWYFSSALTWAGIGFNSDYHYLKSSAEIRKYSLITQGLILASRLQIGSMQSIKSGESTPIADRFYAGGSNSVRGWERSDLGPKSDDNLPMGGNSLAEASIELRYPIWNILSGAIFLDLGNVWSGTYDHDIHQLEYAGGAGLRVQTPLGPLRFDVAVPLSISDKDVQFYLNIGESF